MNKQIYVNLPVRDLPAAMAFFTALGYRFNPQFTDASAACLVLGENIYAMLLTHEKFGEFTPRPICDATRATEVLICLACASRAEVDQLVTRAQAAGGGTYAEAKDYGFMYSHGFQDLDGHIWELVYMEPDAGAMQG